MRPVEITNEAIIEAGQALQTAGRNITGFAIRQRVGGGNPTRLKQVWDEHISSKAEAQAEPVAELPVEVAEEVAAVSKALTERISQLATALNDKAVKAAERRVGEVVRAAGEQREQAERELADASQTVEDLESKLDAAEAAGAALENRLAESKTAYQEQAVELAQVQERLNASEKAAKAAAEQHGSELTRREKATDLERKRHEEETGKLRADCELLRNELATVKAEAKAASQTYQAQSKAAAQEAIKLTTQVSKAETERDNANAAAAAAREEAANLRGQLESLQHQVSELTRTLAQPKKDD